MKSFSSDAPSQSWSLFLRFEEVLASNFQILMYFFLVSSPLTAVFLWMHWISFMNLKRSLVSFSCSDTPLPLPTLIWRFSSRCERSHLPRRPSPVCLLPALILCQLQPVWGIKSQGCRGNLSYPYHWIDHPYIVVHLTSAQEAWFFIQPPSNEIFFKFPF